MANNFTSVRSPWLRATTFTILVASLAAILSTAASGKFTWGPPEIPKAQCEALTATSVSPVLKTAIDAIYQERIGAAIIREPQNTWSNLAFVFAGALIWTHDRRTFSRLLAAALCFLGVTSGLYHASLLPSIRTLDVSAMGWVSFALCCVGYAAARRTTPPGSAPPPPPSRAELSVGIIGGALAMTAAFFRNDVRLGGLKPFDTTYTTIAGIGGVFALALFGILRATRAHSNLRPPYTRIVILALVIAVAAFCQVSDRPGRFCCAPDALIQAHAVWHVLMAAAAALAYDVFASIEGRPTLFSRAT